MNDIVTVITPTQHTDELITIYGIISIPIIFLVIVFFVYLGRVSDAIHKQTHHETDCDPLKKRQNNSTLN